MMVLFNFRRSPSRRGKTAVERRAKSSAYPLQMPLFSGERVLPPCRRMALSPLSGVDRVITLLAGQPLRLCGENIDQPLALWQPWAFPGEWALSSVGIVARGLDFNIMSQRGRASATVQVVSDLQCPASEGSLMFYKASGIWPGDAARPAAASAGAVDPANLRPVGSNGRLLLAEIALK